MNTITIAWVHKVLISRSAIVLVPLLWSAGGLTQERPRDAAQPEEYFLQLTEIEAAEAICTDSQHRSLTGTSSKTQCYAEIVDIAAQCTQEHKKYMPVSDDTRTATKAQIDSFEATHRQCIADKHIEAKRASTK